MGLFSKRPPEPLDSSLAELLTGYEEHHQERALKALGRAQKLILSVATNLRPEEMSRLLVIGDVRLGTFLLVTNQRSVEIRGMGNKEIEHADVAEIGLGTSADRGDTVVSIVSQSALLDYRPTDSARFEKIRFRFRGRECRSARRSSRICA